MAIDRTETARALAKIVAYIQCGKREEGIRWCRTLLCLLGITPEELI